MTESYKRVFEAFTSLLLLTAVAGARTYKTVVKVSFVVFDRLYCVGRTEKTSFVSFFRFVFF